MDTQQLSGFEFGISLLLVCVFFDHLVGLMVKASSSGADNPGFDSHLSSHTGDLQMGTPVATLPGAWHYRVSAGTGWSCVSIL